jgi:hypothetical protein
MGKLTDLNDIYKTYRAGLINEHNMEMDGGGHFDIPAIGSEPTTLPVSDNKCNACNSLPCSCNSNSEEDTNLQMAKSELYSILKSADTLMSRLQTATTIEPWQLSKLVKANDYVNSVSTSVEYDEFEKAQKDIECGMKDINKGMVVVSQIKDMLAGEDINVNEEVLKNVIFNIECLNSK